MRAGIVLWWRSQWTLHTASFRGGIARVLPCHASEIDGREGRAMPDEGGCHGLLLQRQQIDAEHLGPAHGIADWAAAVDPDQHDRRIGRDGGVGAVRHGKACARTAIRLVDRGLPKICMQPL